MHWRKLIVLHKTSWDNKNTLIQLKNYKDFDYENNNWKTAAYNANFLEFSRLSLSFSKKAIFSRFCRFVWTLQKVKTKINISWERKTKLSKWNKVFFITFKGLSLKQTKQILFGWWEPDFKISQKYCQFPILGTLDTSIKTYNDNLQKLWCLSPCMQKINSVPNFFFEILQRYCKLVTFSTFRMLDQAHQW